jgi:hypothetical protein
MMNKEMLIAFIKQRVEQLAVAAVVLLILVYLIVVGVTESEAEKTLKDADVLMDNLDKAKKSAIPPEHIVVDYKGELQREIEKAINPVDGADWFVYKRPFVPIRFKVKPPDEGELYASTLSATLDGVKVKLSWTDSEDNKNVQIVGYRILRKGEDDTSFKPLSGGELSAGQKEFTDDGTEPGAEYIYKLQTTAELDPTKQFIKWKVPQVEEKTATVESEEKSVETPFPYVIRVKWKVPNSDKVKLEVEPTLVKGKKLEQDVEIGKELKMKDEQDKEVSIEYKLVEYIESKKVAEPDYIVIEHTRSHRKWKVEKPKGTGAPPPPVRIKN